jgi:hypothetical protein
MIRYKLLGLVLLAFTLGVVGCGPKDTGPRKDMPIKATDGVDPKTGKASKMMEASMEEPSPSKKK